MQIPDVGTAGILYRLFKHLNEYGVVVVATSNRAPNELYQGHFRETLFDPFVRVLEDRMEVACMHSNTDYRVLMANHLDGPGNLFGDPCYIGEGADELLDDAWTIATQGQVRREEKRGYANQERRLQAYTTRSKRDRSRQPNVCLMSASNSAFGRRRCTSLGATCPCRNQQMMALHASILSSCVLLHWGRLIIWH